MGFVHTGRRSDLSGNQRAWRSGGAVLILATALLMTVGSPPVSSQTPTPGPPAGEWIGWLQYDSTATFATDEGDVPVLYTATGNVDFVTATGFISGDYYLNVTAILIDLGSTATALAVGDLTGPATEADMVLDNMVVTSESGGIVIELPFTAAELGNPVGKLVSTGGSCSQVDGTWNQEFAIGMEARGGSVNRLTGTWVALRDTSIGGNDPDSLAAEMAALNAVGQSVLDNLRDGVLNMSDLRDYLAVAEGAITSGTIRSNCDEGIDSGSEADFRSFAAATVDQILIEAALDIESYGDRDFLRLLNTGYRIGTFPTANELTDFYEAEYDRRLAAAIASGDPGTLQLFLASATQLGKHDIADEILALLGELGA